MFIRPDMSVEEPGFAVFDDPVGVFEVRPSASDGLYLSTAQRDSSLILLEQKIVVTGRPVHGRISLACSQGIALYIFGLLRTCCLDRLTSHCKWIAKTKMLARRLVER